jgi:uncharacterized membrane protein YcaP (DUF421 family)
MDLDLARFGASWETLTAIVLSAIGVYIAVIVLTRVAGLRSLAKMSSFDFAATVAVGSTVASTALGSTPLVNGVAALCMLYGLQYLIATLRRQNALRGAVDNSPMLLMVDGEVIEGNLRHTRVSREELWSQLRLAGVRRRDQVRAVILETTGDMSILQVGDEPFDDELLDGVRGAERLRATRS